MQKDAEWEGRQALGSNRYLNCLEVDIGQNLMNPTVSVGFFYLQWCKIAIVVKVKKVLVLKRLPMGERNEIYCCFTGIYSLC